MVKEPRSLFCLLLLLLSAMPADALEYQSSSETRIESDGEVRARVSGGIEVHGRPVTAALLATLRDGEIAAPLLSLGSPFLDYGPLFASGLLKELSRPCGIGSMRQESGIRLTESFDGSTSEGGAIRLPGSSLDAPPFSLFALRRRGLAPEGTRSAGVQHCAEIGGSSVLSTAAEVTLFGSRKGPEDWFEPLPTVDIPSLTRVGASCSTSRAQFTLRANGGVALSSRVSPTGFLSGYGSYHTRVRLDNRRPGISPALSTAFSLSAGVVDPSYVGDDGRYPTSVAVVRPTISVGLSGWVLRGSYSYRLKRLPLLPVVWREQSHDIALTSMFDFRWIEINCGLRERLEFTEEGRTLHQSRTATGLRLPIGPLAASGEVTLRHANDAEDRVDFLGALELSASPGHIEVWVRSSGQSLALGTNAGLSNAKRQVRLSLRFEDVTATGVGDFSFSIHVGSTSG